MTFEVPDVAWLALAAAVSVLAVFLLLGRSRDLHRLRLLAEQLLAGQRAEADTTRAVMAATERAQATQLAGLRMEATRGFSGVGMAMAEEQLRLRDTLSGQLREMRDLSERQLAEIRQTVNEQLHAAVETQMKTSFERVIDQFTALQKAMSEVQSVTSQIGDIKRLFSNVKTRGGWGETQVRAMLDDVLPAGSYETNRKLAEDSDEAVEFAVTMPMRGGTPPWLPIDAKFPVEDYERLLLASEQGDAEGERLARRGLERAIREQARRIQTKYIRPPITVEFAVMYLATDGLYAEIARVPGVIEEIGRVHRVLILGPSLFPALLRTIHLGHVTLSLEQKADQIRVLLGATRTEMLRMDAVLEKLGRQAGGFSNTIDEARRRTRVMSRKLRAVEAISPAEAAELLDLEDVPEEG